MPLAIAVAVALLGLQYTVLVFVPAISRPTAYLVMVAAPLASAWAVTLRGRGEVKIARTGWYAMATSLVIWSAGAYGNLYQEWILGRSNEMYRAAMLAFNLAAVPIAFILAGEWRAVVRPLARATDALMACALGYVFFLCTWDILTARGAPDEIGVTTMVWLLDVQNLFLLTGALLRWYAADTHPERDLFRTLSAFQLSYLLLLFYNNHFVAGDPNFGPQQSSVITIAFAVLGVVALTRTTARPLQVADARLARTIRSASPVILAGALLIASLFVIRVDYGTGTLGVLIAVLGYTARTTLNQARHIERGDILQRERSELQTIAWTDALTGLSNRYALDHALNQIVRHDRPLTQPVSILMVDIDHFKLLNDHYGHPAGDSCLREVARALRSAVNRPSDVLARYGGEEFLALMHDTDQHGALLIAERLRNAVQALAIEHVGSPFGMVTVSIGAATASTMERMDADTLVAAADRALYEAKNTGRNQIRGLTLATS